MTQEEFSILAGKVVEGTATEREVGQYNAYYNAYQAAYPAWKALAARERAELLAETKQQIDGYLLEVKGAKAIKLWSATRIATGLVAAVATIAFGIWFFAYRPAQNAVSIQTEAYAKDIAPGKNGATITLSTGQVIQLSGAKKGVVVGEQLKYDDGSEIASEVAQPRNDGGGGRLQAATIVQMTASTAKGQIYEFTLPDGTHVFLNSDSKIIFPSQFSGKERKILLTGEAYFAVKHNEKQPFRVESKGQIVEDIGTEFNINAYSDEATVKTTLVEGSASVNDHILKPNQQAILTRGAVQVKEVNTISFISWKEGVFSFRNETLPEVMRKIARWYNVEIKFEGAGQSSKTYSGSVSRSDNVSSILRLLEQSEGIRFSVDKRTITVLQE